MRARTVAVVALVALLAGCGGDEPAPAGTAPVPTTAAATPAEGTDALGRGPAKPSPTPTRAGCTGQFPADNVWRADVSKLPVHPRSAAMVASIGGGAAMHPDFGSGTWEGAPIGIPVTTVPAGQKKVTVTFEYAAESDRGPYPIPANAKIEGGPQADGDRHVIVYDKAACKVYELFAAYPQGGGWRAGSGAVFDLRSNKLRPAGWTSADASGLSIFAGLVRYDEVAAGRIGHAIRITVPKTRTGYTWPATHSASSATDTALPQLGQRLRLKASVKTSAMPKQARIVAEAMQRYGVIVADHGSPWFISGAPDDRWDNDALRALKTLTGNDFEVVDAGGLVTGRTSGAVR
ncbi:hypothetical protein O7635_30210 [Asanoa sp. WMMD1127]|uniref:hypothetical protein n=1 Tax=Asanoa sp. WMMD1127 TaxID=3016107 RepID=UPI002415F1FD|nr:hypothetical protein [Asanoa sp. WMMD1127]MDG4826144.1 hypothetical protein [Asanoa sp. WMMD1127]